MSQGFLKALAIILDNDARSPRQFARHAIVALMVAGMAIVPVSVAAAKDENIPDPDQGYVSWAKDIQYWPDEQHARYSVYYSAVNIDGMSPGTSNEFRLVIHNLANEPIDFDVSVDNSGIDKASRPIPYDWVAITEDVRGEKPISSVATPVKGISTSWVHISIPNEGKWKNKKMQTRVEVGERVDEGITGPLWRIYPGPSILVTISTSDHKVGSGEKNAPVILGILVAGVLAIGGVVYGFSRWRWPDHPRPRGDLKRRGKSRLKDETKLGGGEYDVPEKQR